MKPVLLIGETGFDAVHIGLFLGALVLAGLAFWLFSRGRTQATLMGRDLEQAKADAEWAEGELNKAQERTRTLEDVARQAELGLAEANARSAEDEKKFADLAQGVLARANTQFLQLANETFEKHNKGAKGQLQEMMKPIGENFEAFKKRVDEIEKVRTSDKSLLQEQVKSIGESLHRNTAETGKLVNALTAPKGGGRWGEMTLRNVMEQAGLSAYCDFDEQVNDRTEAGNQRPDAVIQLPGHRQIVVDSKVSLDAYMKASETDDPTERAVHLKSHAASVQRHVTTLASKAYQDNLDERVDFVAMFIPGENFFAAALEHAPNLLDAAYAKNVIITTPSTLIGLAKTVSYVWRQEKMTENAREASVLGAQLYERLVVMGGHIDKLGKSLNGAVDNYNKMNSSLEKRVLPTARRFEELEIAPQNKSLPAAQYVDNRAKLPDRTGELDLGGDGKALAAE